MQWRMNGEDNGMTSVLQLQSYQPLEKMFKRGIVAKDDEDEKRVSRKRVTSRLATDSTSDTDTAYQGVKLAYVNEREQAP
jgi:hypothetical protein